MTGHDHTAHDSERCITRVLNVCGHSIEWDPLETFEEFTESYHERELDLDMKDIGVSSEGRKGSIERHQVGGLTIRKRQVTIAYKEQQLLSCNNQFCK